MHNYILHFRFDHIIANMMMTADCSAIRGKVTFVKTEVLVLTTVHLRLFLLGGDIDKMLKKMITFKTLEKKWPIGESLYESGPLGESWTDVFAWCIKSVSYMNVFCFVDGCGHVNRGTRDTSAITYVFSTLIFSQSFSKGSTVANWTDHWTIFNVYSPPTSEVTLFGKFSSCLLMVGS